MTVITPFGPGASASLTVTGTTGNVALPLGGLSVRIVNNGLQLVYIKFGTSAVTATTSDMAMLPNTVETFTISRSSAHTHVAAIAATTGSTLNITAGMGD